MEKLSGVNVDEWEIVDSENANEEGYEYQEISVEELLDEAGMSEAQKDSWGRRYFAINIHLLISSETMPFVAEVLNDRLHDPRLAKMNAIVFLGVKPKGRAKGAYHPLSSEKYASLVKLCLRLGIPFGFDSCSCFAFLKSVESLDLKEDFKKSLYEMSEPCESTLMSAYINTDGVFFPCSFTEGEQGWKEGVDVVGCKDFLKDVWHNRKVTEVRRKIMNCRECRESCFNFKEINVKWE